MGIEKTRSSSKNTTSWKRKMVKLLSQSLVLSSFCLTFSFADFAKMKRNFDMLVAQDRSLNPDSSRALSQETLNSLQEYGCWCYFDQLHGKGKSKPVNEVDTACKTLADGYECAIIDGEDENEPCTPWEVSYNSSTAFGGETMVAECLRDNVDSCSRRACMVEGHFIGTLFMQYLQGFNVDSRYKHSEGFEPNMDNCPTQMGVKSEKACCSDYPERFTFKSYGGDRKCCGSKTYDSTILVCCDDGQNQKAKMSC